MVWRRTAGVLGVSPSSLIILGQWAVVSAQALHAPLLVSQLKVDFILGSQQSPPAPPSAESGSFILSVAEVE